LRLALEPFSTACQIEVCNQSEAALLGGLFFVGIQGGASGEVTVKAVSGYPVVRFHFCNTIKKLDYLS
jgi:hypothetical protein